MRPTIRLLATLLLLCACAPALALRVEDIPTPRPAGWVVDRADLLSPGQEAELGRLGDAIHAKDGAELAVVTVRSVEGADPRTFATALFRHWAIGDATRDNGALLFVAIDDRAAELVLGDGVDTDDQVGTTDDIMQRTIVPHFRAGAPDRAILDGARETARRLFRVGDGATPAPVAALEPAAGAADAPYAEPDNDVPKWLAAAGGGGGLLAALVALVRRWLRRRPRACTQCRSPMQRLDEAADDAHLTPGERVEERLGSVDYDVWKCSVCANVDKLRYGAFFTSFKQCPQCRSVTKSSAETTLVSATYSHGGVVRVDERCEHCGWTQSSERATPQLTRSSSSGSGSGFGGGSTSGRGSSGRW